MGTGSELRVDEARRIHLAATGLARPRPRGRIDRRHLRREIERLGVVQIDSVNVAVRAHYVPLYSRLGPYRRETLDEMAYRDHELFEYWAHVASLVDVRLHPLLRWRMAESHGWTGLASVAEEHPTLVEELRHRVVEHGPVSAGALDEDSSRKGPWWGWSTAKRAIEHLFHKGEVGAIRGTGFERLYCDPASCLPPGTLDLSTPPPDDAKRALVETAARAHGIGTAKDLADYFRLKVADTRRLLDELAEDGVVERVGVQGWSQTAYRHRDATLPRRCRAATLVSPFDQVMWERERVTRLFDFEYRIEIYTPAPKRRHGYYVYPFLLGDRFVARVDLKADRAGSRLLVRAAWREPGTDDAEIVAALHPELVTFAGWLGLDDVHVEPTGDLAPALGASA